MRTANGWGGSGRPVESTRATAASPGLLLPARVGSAEDGTMESSTWGLAGTGGGEALTPPAAAVATADAARGTAVCVPLHWVEGSAPPWP